MHYMLDTNICIYIIRRQPLHVFKRLSTLERGDAVMSVITYAELRAGLEIQSTNRTQDENTLAALVQRIPVLPFTQADAINFGVLRAAVRDRTRDAMDRLIAAHAVSADVTLVSNNEADFQGYPGLRLENWITL